MNAKQYAELVERNISKGIITDTELSRQMPVMVSVRKLKKLQAKEVKPKNPKNPKKQKSYSDAEMKEIFNNLMQNV